MMSCHVTLAQGQGGTPVDEPHADGDTWRPIEGAHAGGLVCVDVQPFDSRPFEEAGGYAPTGRRGRAATFKSFGALRHVFAVSAALPRAPAHPLPREVVRDSAAGNRFVASRLGTHLCDGGGGGGAAPCAEPACIVAGAVSSHLRAAAGATGARARVLAPRVAYCGEPELIGNARAGEYPALRLVEAVLPLADDARGGAGGAAEDGLRAPLHALLAEAIGGRWATRVVVDARRGGAAAQAFGAGAEWLTLASCRWLDAPSRLAELSVNLDALLMATLRVPDVRALWSREGRTRGALKAALRSATPGAPSLADLRACPAFVPPSLFPPRYAHQVSSWVPAGGLDLGDVSLLLRHIAGDLVDSARVVDVYTPPPAPAAGGAAPPPPPPRSPRSAGSGGSVAGRDGGDEVVLPGDGPCGGGGADTGRTAVTLEVVYSSVDCALPRTAASSLQFCLRGALTVLGCDVR